MGEMKSIESEKKVGKENGKYNTKGSGYVIKLYQYPSA